MNSTKSTRTKPQQHGQTCKHCGKPFNPDYRNAYHQKYCTKLKCRKASKKASQAKWLAKNPGFFSGPEHVVRVQVWRHDKRSGKGRNIYKLVIEFMIFRRRGCKDRVEVVKKDGDGVVLQDFCALKNTMNTYVILRLGNMLQDIIALIHPEPYSFPSSTGRTGSGGRRKCQEMPQRE